MKPFVLVEVEDGTVDETHVVGVPDLEVIVVDFDPGNMDGETAYELVRDIMARYRTEGGTFEQIPESIGAVISRLMGIYLEEHPDEGDDEEADDPEVLDALNNHGQGEDDEKKESDYADEFEFNMPGPDPFDTIIPDDALHPEQYNANALIPGAEPSVIDPRD